jgi:N-acyl-D-aspartate/D-glutamate deacylase
MFDLLIRGGTVIDGTGAPGEVRDVAVLDGRLVDADGTGARRTIDASGLMVTPGFVDLHTHYDAQLSWDPTASPSPLHGVTTVLGGNCGFSLAPSGPDHADYLMRMMARVEGMPLEALQQGLAWDWSSFAEWSSRLEGHIGVNAGFLVGHSAIRRVVMGDASVDAPADQYQIDRMVEELHAALATGALGFSTSQAPTHNDGDTRPVPSRAATREELEVLAAAVRDHPGTTMELILAGCLNGFDDEEVDLMVAMSLAANRPINWNVLGVSSLNPTGHESQLAVSDRAAERGATIVALTLPHTMRIRVSLLTGTIFDGLPGWRPILALPVPERIAALRDPSVRKRLAEGAQSPEAGILRHFAQWQRLEIAEAFAPENVAFVGQSFGAVAASRGQDPFDAMLDFAIRDGLRTGIRPPSMPETAQDWQLKASVWRDPRTIVGGSDAGAHLDMMCGAIYSTTLLASVRDHETLTWEEAVQQLTDVPARFYGLNDRGRLATGYCADIVLVDPTRVAAGGEYTREDLPGGASRLYADSSGIEHVLVNGTSVVTDQKLTGALPGTFLRSGRDTSTVTVPGGGL